MLVALYELHPGDTEPLATLRWLGVPSAACKPRLTGDYWTLRKQLQPYLLDVITSPSGWVTRNSMTGQRNSNFTRKEHASTNTNP